MTRRDAAVLFATSAAGPMLAPAAAMAASFSRAKNVVLVHGLLRMALRGVT